MSDVLVVGCGLIGTSIGLALRGTSWDDVTLWDRDPGALHQAEGRGAGRAWDQKEPARLAVVAVPPGLTAAALTELQSRKVATTYTHVCSIQSQVQHEIKTSNSDLAAVVGGHPLAGREISGASGALVDLFVGRPWAVCPSPESSDEAVADVERLAALCGAAPVRLTAELHDRTVALVSHLPQVVASALAGVLVPDSGSSGEAPVTLSGPGLADTTRLAASDPDLWTEILASNAPQVAGPVRTVARELASLAGALTLLAEGSPDEGAQAREAVRAFLRRGNEGRALVPLKRGRVAEAFVGVRVDVADEPGRLAALLGDAAAADVNVEDVRVEHVPGRPRGVIELLVAAEQESRLRDWLRERGWRVL